jgi:TonB family protein
MRAVVCIALAATAAIGATAVLADTPDPRQPMWQANESGWIRDVQRRLESEVDHSRGVGRVAVAEVLFQVGADGKISEAALVGPSGSAVLDEVTLQAVRRARTLPPPPQSLAGTPVRFRLEVSKPASLPLTW